MIIDNFTLVTHQTCPTKYRRRIVEAWTGRGKSPALSAGANVHYGLAEWYRRRSTGDNWEASLLASMEAMAAKWEDHGHVDDHRTLDKCLGVMRDYAKHYPDESFEFLGGGNGSALIERVATIDLGLTCDDGEPIEYGMILDGGIQFNDLVYTLEHKTTSQLSSYYFHQFKPNNQITGYIWGLQQLTGRQVGGALINAIGIYKASATRFERHITSRAPAEIDEWKRNVKSVCDEIKFHERNGYWPMRTQSCTMYGLCEYHGVCSMHPNDRERMLDQNYVKHPWDHERRDTVEVTGKGE